MNKIIYNIVYNRKKCLNKKGMALVQVEAYLGRKKKYFSTKVYLKPEQWDNKKLIVKNHPNADALNRLIYEFVATIEKKELELWQQGKRISLELLKNALTTQENNSSGTKWVCLFSIVFILYFLKAYFCISIYSLFIAIFTCRFRCFMCLAIVLV